MEDAYNRFDLVFEDSAEELREQRKKKLEINKIERAAALEERKRIENGGCEGCGTKEYNRWIHNGEVYLCQDCFMNDLQCEAEVQVPMHRADDMDGYDEYLNWDDLWENNE